MTTDPTGFIRKTIYGLFNYRRNVAYWRRTEKEAARPLTPPIPEPMAFEPIQAFLTSYETFAAHALESYKTDIEPYAGFAENETVLQRCIALMRRELSTEAERLCESYHGHISDLTAFREALNKVAEGAVCQLSESTQDSSLSLS